MKTNTSFNNHKKETVSIPNAPIRKSTSNKSRSLGLALTHNPFRIRYLKSLQKKLNKKRIKTKNRYIFAPFKRVILN